MSEAPPETGLFEDPEEFARAAGLDYVTAETPGITRRRCGTGFTYTYPDGRTVPRGPERQRIEELAIPPAWTDVWICPDPEGHIQATGRDDAGRKQYRYHPRWIELRNETKFHRLTAFGEALPALRERVEKDLKRRGLPREKVLALVVRLLEITRIRVGNHEYARDNGTYGLTTLRDKHVEVKGSRVAFRFRAKGGADRELDLRDRRLARLVRKCRDVPGYELFQYYDEEERRRPVDSGEVNDYLREALGGEFTAKDFRTWTGSCLALECLLACPPCEGEREVQKAQLTAVDEVAGRLGNTRAVCRQFYIHPAVLIGFEEGWLAEAAGSLRVAKDGLDPIERSLMRVLSAAVERRQEESSETEREVA